MQDPVSSLQPVQPRGWRLSPGHPCHGAILHRAAGPGPAPPPCTRSNCRLGQMVFIKPTKGNSPQKEQMPGSSSRPGYQSDGFCNVPFGQGPPGPAVQPQPLLQHPSPSSTPIPPPDLPFFWFSPLIWDEQHKRSNFSPHPLPILPPPLSGRSVLLLRHLRLWLSESRRMTAKNQMLYTDKLQGHYAEAAVPYKSLVFIPLHDFPCGIVWFQHLGVTVNVSRIFC